MGYAKRHFDTVSRITNASSRAMHTQFHVFFFFAAAAAADFTPSSSLPCFGSLTFAANVKFYSN